MTFFFVFRLAFSTYPCCWKEKWRNLQKSGPRYHVYGKILVRRWSGPEMVKKKENWKISEKIRTICRNFGKILVWRRSPVEKEICKKVQKESPNGTIFGKILIGKRGGFLINHKKILKKVHFFQPLSFFSGRYLVTAKKGINNISHAKKEKIGNNGKNQTTSGFLSKILVRSHLMATSTTTLNEQKGKSMNNTS